MGKLIVYNFITLNGFYKGPNSDTSWHHHGEEQLKYSEEMLAKDNILLFGRTTYEMMESFWTSKQAKESMPIVAEGMNKSEKIVFSNSLKKANWNNTTVANDLLGEVKKQKQISTKDMAVLGSGSIVTQLANARLVDEFQLMIDPIAIGEGTPLFKGLTHSLDLQLTKSRVFNNGVVLVYYKPKE